MAGRKRPASRALAEDADRILDATLAEADKCGWANVRLRIVAAGLGMGLDEVGRHFRDLDAVADAWFARARAAMLAPVPEGFAERSARDRIEFLMLRWFDALEAYRRVTVDMLTLKMWPFHPHHFVPLPFNLSRTVIWLRDAAGLDAERPRREVEEVALTWLFVGTLAVWATDGSPDQERTRRFLGRALDTAQTLLEQCP